MTKISLQASGLLLFNSGYIFRRLRKESEQLGIRWLHLTLLKDIDLLAPVTQKALAKANHLSGPSISIAVNEMVELDWVTRIINPNDKRSSTLSLTEPGKEALRKNGLRLQKCLLPWLNELDASELKGLVAAESALAKLFAQ